MATTIWTGDTDGDWSDSTNFSGDVPSAGDTVIVPYGGTQNVTEGLDQNATALAEVVLEDDCSLDIAGGEAPLILGLQSTGTMTLGGAGTVYLQVSQASSSSSRIDINDAGKLYLSSYSTAILADALHVAGGDGDVFIAWRADEAARVGEITIGSGVTAYIGDGVVDTDDTTLPELTASKGTVYNRAAVTTLNNRGAVIHHQDGEATTINAHAGTTYYDSDDAPGTINIYDGVVDASRNVKGCTSTTVNIYGTGRFRDPNNAFGTGTVINDYRSGEWGTKRAFTITDI